MFTARSDRTAEVFADASVTTEASAAPARLRVIEGGRPIATPAADDGREWSAEKVALALNWVAG